MLDGAMLVWFVLTGVSLLLLLIDLFSNSPVSWVQKLAWFLVVCYTGPVGLFAYLYACRRPFKGGHDAATKAWWKQGINSEVHCLAGDATGIIIAASIVPAFAITNGWDIVIEYIAGFVCGLFIFQALMMIKMFNGNYFMAVRKTFFAEAVSMNFVMAGMIPTMVLLAAVWPDSMEPTAWDFWFRMSLASIVGGILLDLGNGEFASIGSFEDEPIATRERRNNGHGKKYRKNLTPWAALRIGYNGEDIAEKWFAALN